MAIAFGMGISSMTVVVVGLAAGALLAEACALVPYWRALTPEAFLTAYKTHAAILLRFFGRIEIVSTGLSVLVAALAWCGYVAQPVLWSVAAALSLAILITFPLYFQRVNASFADASIAHAQVAGELQRWAAWHNARTSLSLAQFAVALHALSLCS